MNGNSTTEPILVKSREKWLGEDIALELIEIKQKLGTILYAVSDAGNGIKRGLKEADILWRYDITHAIAITLDKMYRDNGEFKDLIESTFRKYKNELSKNPMNGITDLVLLIPALTAKLEVDSVLDAIDSCTVKDIEVWKNENLCNSLLAKRNAVYKN